jgi:hypothetical protein
MIWYAEVGQKTATRAPMGNMPGRGRGQQRVCEKRARSPVPPAAGEPSIGGANDNRGVLGICVCVFRLSGREEQLL